MIYHFFVFLRKKVKRRKNDNPRMRRMQSQGTSLAEGIWRAKSELLTFPPGPNTRAALLSPPREHIAEDHSPRDLSLSARKGSPTGDVAFVGCPGHGDTFPPLCFSFFSFRELGTVGITRGMLGKEHH